MGGGEGGLMYKKVGERVGKGNGLGWICMGVQGGMCGGEWG